MSFTQQEKNGLFELTPEAEQQLQGSKYFNPDLAPTKVEQRTWGTSSIMNLWIGMSICIPSLALASSLVSMGVSPMLSVLNVILGNLIVLIPIQLNSQIGTKYGIPFPIFARMTFGAKGAQVPTIARSIVACGWTSVQAWVGGGALAAIIGIVVPMFKDQSVTVAMPGNSGVVVGQLIGFFLFMLLVFLVAFNGLENVRWVQNIGGPILVVVIIALFGWSVMALNSNGSSLAAVFSAGNDWALIEASGGFAYVYMAGLTANIAFWSTIALNIPDFSRLAKSQKDQFNGQMLGMPIPMAACAFIGAVFAEASRFYTADGSPSFDPTTIFYYIDNPIIVFIAAIGTAAATITTCVAANVVAPANGFSNINPKKISYKMGVVITVLFAIIVMEPWWIYGSGAAYIFTWLNNYGTIIAPIAAILVADYFISKEKRVNVMDLYKEGESVYNYSNGWNVPAFIAWIAAFIIPLLGNTVFLYGSSGRTAPAFIDYLAANGYILSFAIGFILYWILMKSAPNKHNYGFVPADEYAKFTKMQ